MAIKEMSSPLSRIIDHQLLAEVRRVKLRTRRTMSADLLGQYRSAFRGTGLVFTDIREYAPGDDIKHIHWKITARSPNGKAYVKSYDEDRQLNLMLAIDTSSSTDFGTGKSKHQKIIEFAALMSLLAKNSQDNVGLCSFSGKVEDFFPPSRSRSQFERIFSRLLAPAELQPSTNLASALSYLNEQQRRSSIIFVVSDFYSPPFEDELRKLALRHDVICALVQHDMDADLPNSGIVQFADAESGERIVIDTSSDRSRAYLRTMAEKQEDFVRTVAKNAGCDFMCLKNNPVRPLVDLMRGRKARLH